MNAFQISSAVVGALAVLALGALLLPRHVTVQRQATLQAPPADILALASSSRGYQRFNPYAARDASLKIEHFGPDMGVGSGFRFDGKEGKGSQVVAALSPEHVEYQLDLGPIGKPTQRLQTEASAQGTKVAWTMQMDLGMNPIARVFGLFMDKMMGATFEEGLQTLSAATSRG